MRVNPVVVGAIGAAGGLASGLLGVGGGIVMVPLLVAAAGLGQREAHATSLAAIVPVALAGAATFAAAGHIEGGPAILLAAGALAGAPVGARILAAADETALRLGFGLFAIAVGIVLLWR